MEPMGDVVHADLRVNTAKNIQKQTDREPSLAECVEKAVRRFLSDRGEHEPDNFYHLVIREVEKPLLKETLAWAEGNQSRCAAILGLSRGTLRKKLKEHCIL